MYITFDYRDPDTGEVEARFVKRSEMDEQRNSAGKLMVRLPAGTRTTFRFADSKLKG